MTLDIIPLNPMRSRAPAKIYIQQSYNFHSPEMSHATHIEGFHIIALYSNTKFLMTDHDSALSHFPTDNVKAPDQLTAIVSNRYE